MTFELTTFTLRELCNLIRDNRIDLNPSYQRNFIWTAVNQKQLIDTILKKFPLPAFFIYQKPDGKYEMVDGQQRSKTIFRFVLGEITSSTETGKVSFERVEQDIFLAYWIPIILIKSVGSDEELRDFYVLINKRGVHLNPAEINKSEFFETNFLKLAESLLSYQPFISLELFSEANIKRMNDRAFVEELVAYLYYRGPKDKKTSVKSAFQEDITEEESNILSENFKSTIDRIAALNSVHPIAETRYKQKNDFYTLFNFVSENPSESLDVLVYQYRILLLLDGDDREGRQYIRPSNEECQALKTYANNCVTQSNSKSAREGRLNFFNQMLKNDSPEGNDVLNEVIDYLFEEMEKEFQLVKINGYYLIGLD
jgi:hypothetical protein